MTGATPITELSPGELAAAREPITEARIARWSYAAECDAVGSTFPVDSVFQIVAISTTPDAMWIRIRAVGRNPPTFLKVTAEEYADAFIDLGPVTGIVWKPDLTYSAIEARLFGWIDGQSIDVRADSGGGAGGPVPAGRYSLRIHEERAHWIRLAPHDTSVRAERAGFAIHGRGQVGSHGCIVPVELSVVGKLTRLVLGRSERGHAAPTLEVVVDESTS